MPGYPENPGPLSPLYLKNKSDGGKKPLGRWYDHYQTPKELVDDRPYHTVTSEFRSNGLSMEPWSSANVKVFVVGPVPEITPVNNEFMILYHALGLPAIVDNNMINVILLFKKGSDLLNDTSGEEWTKARY